MAAYLVVTADIKDRRAFLARYAAAAGELTVQFGGEYVVRAPGIEFLEGDGHAGGSLVISKWPDKEAIFRFWHSDEYAELKKHRRDIAECRVFCVEEPA